MDFLYLVLFSFSSNFLGVVHGAVSAQDRPIIRKYFIIYPRLEGIKFMLVVVYILMVFLYPLKTGVNKDSLFSRETHTRNTNTEVFCR